MVSRRAREVALINGHPERVSPSDWEEAKRELSGEESLFPTESAAEALPESGRWDPTPGSVGHKVTERPANDEQSDAEKLTEEGLAEAEHDRMVEGTKESLRRDEA